MGAFICVGNGLDRSAVLSAVMLESRALTKRPYIPVVNLAVDQQAVEDAAPYRRNEIDSIWKIKYNYKRKSFKSEVISFLKLFAVICLWVLGPARYRVQCAPAAAPRLVELFALLFGELLKRYELLHLAHPFSKNVGLLQFLSQPHDYSMTFDKKQAGYYCL